MGYIRSISILLINLALIYSFSAAQSSFPETIRIYCPENAIDNATDIVPGTYCYTPFLDDIIETLADYDIDIDLITDPTLDVNYALAFTRYDNGTDLIFFSPEPYETALDATLPVSDLVKKHADIHMLTLSGLNAAIVDLVTGVLLYAQNQCEQAQSHFAALRSDDPAMPHTSLDATARYYIATCHILDEDYDAARASLESLDEAELNNLMIFALRYPITLAWTRVQTGDNDAAFTLMDATIEQYQRNALASSQDYIGLYAQRGKLYALAFDYTQAITDLDTAIDIATDNAFITASDLADLYTTRADIIMLIYEWERARGDYNQALELDPELAPAYFKRGILRYTLAERDGALADFEKYLSLAPDGDHADDAISYIDSIQTELDALNQ